MNTTMVTKKRDADIRRSSDGALLGMGWITIKPEMKNYYRAYMKDKADKERDKLILTPATSGSVGIDLCSDHDADVLPGERHTFDSGVRLYMRSEDMAGFIYSRSGLGAKKGLVIAQGVGVIDRDYTGPLLMVMLNNSKETIHVCTGDRIAQLVFQQIRMPVLYEISEDNMPHTDRGDGGFGSTGK